MRRRNQPGDDTNRADAVWRTRGIVAIAERRRDLAMGLRGLLADGMSKMDVAEGKSELHQQREQRHKGHRPTVGPEPAHEGRITRPLRPRHGGEGYQKCNIITLPQVKAPQGLAPRAVNRQSD